MKNKTVWVAEWNNGQDYEDNDTYFIGVYSTEEKAKIAAQKYNKEQIDHENTYNPGNTSWYVYEVEIDK